MSLHSVCYFLFTLPSSPLLILTTIIIMHQYFDYSHISALLISLLFSSQSSSCPSCFSSLILAFSPYPFVRRISSVDCSSPCQNKHDFSCISCALGSCVCYPQILPRRRFFILAISFNYCLRLRRGR